MRKPSTVKQKRLDLEGPEAHCGGRCGDSITLRARLPIGLFSHLVSSYYEILPIAHLCRCAHKHLSASLKARSRQGHLSKEGKGYCKPATEQRNSFPELEGQGTGKVVPSEACVTDCHRMGHRDSGAGQSTA